MNGNGPFDPRKEAPLISAYVDGELEPHETARIEAHLAAGTPESEATRKQIEDLRRLGRLTGAMRLAEPPPEAWESFWQNFYNRTERSLGWVLLTVGLVVIGAWAVLQLVTALAAATQIPLVIKGGILLLTGGILVLLISIIRERIFKRNRTRYKDIVR